MQMNKRVVKMVFIPDGCSMGCCSDEGIKILVDGKEIISHYNGDAIDLKILLEAFDIDVDVIESEEEDEQI